MLGSSSVSMTDAEEQEIRRLARLVLKQPGRPIWKRALAWRRATSTIHQNRLKSTASKWTAEQARNANRRGKPAKPHAIDSVHVGDTIRLPARGRRVVERRVLAIRFGPRGTLSAVLLSPFNARRAPTWHRRTFFLRRVYVPSLWVNYHPFHGSTDVFRVHERAVHGVAQVTP